MRRMLPTVIMRSVFDICCQYTLMYIYMNHSTCKYVSDKKTITTNITHQAVAAII